MHFELTIDYEIIRKQVDILQKTTISHTIHMEKKLDGCEKRKVTLNKI